MTGTGGRLDECCFDVTEVADLEDLGLRVGAVLGETAAQVDAMAGPLQGISILLDHVVSHLYRGEERRTFSQSRPSPRRQ